MLGIGLPCSFRKGDHSIGRMREQETVSRTRFQGIPFVICPDDDHGVMRPSRCNPSENMAVGMVDIENIEPFPVEIPRETEDVLRILYEKGRLINLKSM